MDIKVIIFAIIIIIIAIFLIKFVMSRKTPNKNILYERLGGVYQIALVVDYFSDELINNPIVGKQSNNPYLSDWSTNKLDRLPGLKFMRTLWLCAVSGGPFNYKGTVSGKCPLSLENAHRKFEISPEEFDEVVRVLSQSLNHFSIPQKEKNEVIAAFIAHKTEVDTGFFNSRNINVASPSY
jgi:hemoglobin